MSDIDKKITELEELRAKATPRPWYETVTGEGIPSVNAAEKEDYHGFSIAVQGMIQNPANISLIVAEHNALPELIAEIKKLRNVAEAEFAEIEAERDAAIARAEKAEATLPKLLEDVAYLDEEAGQYHDEWQAAERSLKEWQELWNDLLSLANIELEPGDEATAKDIYDQIALKFNEERNAAIARAEKAEADLLIEQRVLAGFKVMLETAKECAEMAEAQVRWLAEQVVNAKGMTAQGGWLASPVEQECPVHKDKNEAINTWVQAAHEPAKRGEEV